MCPATCAGRIDLDATIVVPDRRRIVFEIPNWTMRRAILHIIEAMARHAGLTDITRESIDGATLYQLLAAREGWSAERRTRAAKTWTPRIPALALLKARPTCALPVVCSSS